MARKTVFRENRFRYSRVIFHLENIFRGKPGEKMNLEAFFNEILPSKIEKRQFWMRNSTIIFAILTILKKI